MRVIFEWGRGLGREALKNSDVKERVGVCVNNVIKGYLLETKKCCGWKKNVKLNVCLSLFVMAFLGLKTVDTIGNLSKTSLLTLCI